MNNIKMFYNYQRKKRKNKKQIKNKCKPINTTIKNYNKNHIWKNSNITSNRIFNKRGN